MNRNQRIVVSIVGIIIVTLALIGITYAYFLTRIIGNSSTTSISGTLADLELTYIEGNGLVSSSNMVPGTSLTPKTFEVKNTGTTKIENYAVVFESLTNNLDRKDDLVYTLNCSSDNGNSCNGVKEAPFPSIDSSVVLNSIEPNETHSYTLTVTYKNLDDVDQSDDMGKSFSAKVNIKDGKDITYFDIPYTLAYNVINNAKSEKNGTTYRKYPKTNPGSEFNGIDEKILSEKEDDYGTSYYYRGDVTDNYLTFNNMCWRVVRIEGDGSTKIILEDSEGPCSLNSGKNYSIGKGGYGDYEGKADYANGDSSSMRKQFQSWYRSSGLSEYESKLKNDKWITGDTSVIYGHDDFVTEFHDISEFLTSAYTEPVGTYASGKRIKNMESPRLTTKTSTEFKEQNYVFDYIGTLTADEMVLAGSRTSGEMTSSINYLYLDDLPWWSLTQSGIMGKYPTLSYYSAFIYTDNLWGSGFSSASKTALGSADRNAKVNFRPSVVLNPDVAVTGQGTKADPYIVK